MYPKDRLPRSKTQMPSNLVTLFAHVMSRANEGSRGSAVHSWDEVLNPTSPSSTDSSSAGPCPMSAQDWRKAEAFSVHLQSLIAARHTRCNSNGNGRVGTGQNSTCSASSFSTPFSTADGGGGARRSSPPAVSNTQAASASSSVGKHLPHSNGKVKSRAKPPGAPTVQTSERSTAGAMAATAAAVAATPNPAPTWSRHHVPRVTPREPSRAGEPSAPMKAVGNVAASRRVNGGAEGAVASLAVSRAGPGAFETPSHSSHNAARPGALVADECRGRDHSPSRYPARLRSRRFSQLGGSGESPEPPQPRGFERGAEAPGDDDQTQGGRRLSPRNSHTPLIREHGRGLSSDHQLPHDWLVAAAAAAGGGGGGGSGSVSAQVNHCNEDGEDGDGQSYGMRTRAAPKAAHDLEPDMASSSSGTCTPQMGTGGAGSPVPMEFRPAPPPIMGAAAVSCPSPRVEVAARPRQVLQGGRSGGRATPVPRSSVGGRNYTDNHVKQLGLIEAAVVISATPKDRAMYNLPRQGRTLTLTNVFKFIALRGAGTMYRLATAKQVEAHTGRHSNFFDGKIDARIVGIIKTDIGDEAITKSRKFSKILLSLIAEGCTHPDCDWNHSSFTTDKIANLQARMEAETGTSALKFCGDPISLGGGGVGAAAAAAGAAAAPSPLGPGPFAGAGSSDGPANGAHSKRRLDLGRDDASHTPSPRLKKLQRAARVRMTGPESTPNADDIGNSKSPPKEEDDVRAAEVLQGLKGVGGPTV